MKVLHAPVNIAGQASTIAKAQRELGVEADVIVFKAAPYYYPCDVDLKLDKTCKLLWPFVIIGNFIACAFKYDVFHFYYGKSLLPGNIDMPILKALGKVIVVQYFGSDAMQKDVALKFTCFTKEQLDEIYPKLNDDHQRYKIEWMRKNSSFLLTGIPLLPFVKNAKITYTALDLDKIRYVGPVRAGKFVKIVHAPSRRDIKGTKFIIDAVKTLREEGYLVELALLENASNRKVLDEISSADIVVDDILQGPHGALALESMAMGKPVIGFVHNKFIQYYPGLPTIIASPDTIWRVLRNVISSPTIRSKHGVEGREYVEKHHDARKLAAAIIEMYKEAMHEQ